VGRLWKKEPVKTIVTIWAIGLLASLFSSSGAWAAPSGGSAALCLAGNPTTFNPQLASDETTLLATRPIYNQLVELRPAGAGQSGTRLEPGLADSWDISKDGRVYTFHLRHKVHFQQTAYFNPTRCFGADDVLFSFNRQLLSAHPFHAVGGGVYRDFSALGLQKNVDEVEKINKHLIRFHLIHPDPSFLSKLASDSASILSAEYGEVLLSKGTAWEIDSNPIGTGPYRLDQYSKGKEIRYSANKSYFRNSTNSDPLVMTILPSATLRDAKVQAGQCQAPNQFQFP
jgi:dipeptide transport system substrate-binding protein